jgi:hypothetical protein
MLAELVRQLPKPPKPPKGTKVPAFKEQVEAALPAVISAGRVFACPSGKDGETRYWAQDERLLLRAKAVEAAEKPLPLSSLQSAVTKALKGADKEFVESEIRGLIGQGILHPHPAQGKKGGESFGSSPYIAPPPLPKLEQKPYHKDLEKLAQACQKLAAKAEVGADELLAALRSRLATLETVPTPPAEPAAIAEVAGPAVAPGPAAVTEKAEVVEVTAPVGPPPSAPTATGPDAIILEALRGHPVVSLRDLRQQMPPEHRGASFDQAILRLDDQQKVVLYSDANPASFDDATKAEFVQDSGVLFTTVSLRG